MTWTEPLGAYDGSLGMFVEEGVPFDPNNPTNKILFARWLYDEGKMSDWNIDHGESVAAWLDR